jgi:hypothetical protein
MASRSLAALLSFIVCSPCFANVSETGLITNLVVENSGELVSVLLDGADVTNECSGGFRWTFSMTEPLAKEKYAMLLLAAATGKAVELFHATTAGCGPYTSNKIYFIQLRPL